MALGIRSFANTYSLKETGYCLKILYQILIAEVLSWTSSKFLIISEQKNGFENFLTNFYADFSRRRLILSAAPGFNHHNFKFFSTVEKYSSEHGYLAPANGPGAPGQYTKRRGTLAFYEICDVTNKWYLRVVRDHESKEMFPNSVSLKYFTQNLIFFCKTIKKN